MPLTDSFHISNTTYFQNIMHPLQIRWVLIRITRCQIKLLGSNAKVAYIRSGNHIFRRNKKKRLVEKYQVLESNTLK